MLVTSTVTVTLAILVALAFPSPAKADEPLRVDPHTTAMTILAKDPAKEGAFAACLFRLYAQGLGIKAAQRECEVQLPTLSGPPGTPLPAGRLSASSGIGLRCPGTLSGPVARGVAYSRPYVHPNHPTVDLGEYSWGGSGEVTTADGRFAWRGLTEAESLNRKEDAVDRYLEAHEVYRKSQDEWWGALRERDAAQKSGDPARIKAAEERIKKAREASEEATKKMFEAYEDAKKDPNKFDPGVAQPDPGAPPGCGADVLAFLRECDRVDWRSGECAELKAQVENCADPALIFPDPLDGAVQCGEKLATAEEVATALEQWCRERVRYGPDVEDPCSIKPREGNPETREMELKGTVWDAELGGPTVCGSPLAHVTEDSCVATLSVPSFGHRSMEDVLLWGLDRLGGPVFILPADPRAGGPRPPLDPPKG